MTQRIAHYELLERIGEGGMGIVYKARDTRLDRLVALKFLSPELDAGSEEIEQFLHEARAISRLNHPNIATIYAVEQDEGDRFLAFEYLAGGTLRDAVLRAGASLPLDKIFTWSAHVARALAHAHRHGIIHRDVKSANALLNGEGAVKLTAFGLALASGSRAPALETAGTVAYMAPELAQGAPADALSDQFSFGVVVFELVAGRTPFQAETQAEILYDIVHAPAPRLRSLRPDAPEELEAIVSRLLEKDRGARFASMDRVVDVLERAADRVRAERTTQEIPVFPAPAEPAVAVLPLVDMSPRRDQEVFCDDVAEEILSSLSAVEGLKVVSRGSSFQFKGQPYDVREIGRTLGVETLLEGSVRKAGDRLRISVQHVEASTGRHLWAERFDRGADDVFAIQDEIAQAVAANFRLHLARPERVVRPTANLEAYNLYLAGRFYLNQRRKEAVDRALEAFQAAHRLDPGFALAAAGLAESYILLAAGQRYPGDPRTLLGQAREWAQKAVELDPLRAEGYVPLAQVALRADWDWTGAEANFQKAIELNPSYATARHQYAMYLSFVGRLGEAREQIDRARELDPLSPIIATAVGRILTFCRDFDGAVAQLKQTIALDPTFLQARLDLLVAYACCDRLQEAREQIDDLARLSGDPAQRSFIESRYKALTGDLEGARRERQKVVEAARSRPISPALLALIDMSIGDLDRAMDELFEAVENKDNLLVFVQCEPTYDAIRSHPRYPELLARIGFPTAPPSDARSQKDG